MPPASLLVIVGAGASNDAISRDPFNEFTDRGRPPLTDELFKPRQGAAADWDPVTLALGVIPEARGPVDELAHIVTSANGVEAVLSQWAAEAASGSTVARQYLRAAQYFIRERLKGELDWAGRAGGLTNYVTLVARINRWREATSAQVTYVTFNYDRLLDQALEAEVLTLDDMNAYIGNEHTTMIKAHGSISWWHSVDLADTQDVQRRVIRDMPDSAIRDDFVLADSPNGPSIPAVAIPTTNKDQFVCPTSHVARLMSELPAVTHVLSIGWAGRDPALLDMLAASGTAPARLEVVTRHQQSADEVINRIRPALSGPEPAIAATGDGFANYVAKPREQWFVLAA